MLRALVIFLFTSLSFGQGLVLKHVDSSTSYQQYYYAMGDGVDQAQAVWLNALISQRGAWDFDSDGIQDLVTKRRPVGGGPDSWISSVYSGSNYALLWSTESEPSINGTWTLPMFFDLTGDGNKEVVLVNLGDGMLMVWSPVLHTCLMTTDVSGYQYLILDYDGDAVQDIIVRKSNPGYEYYYEFWGAGQVASSPPTNLVIQSEGNDLVLQWTEVDSCSLYDIQWVFNLDGEYASVGTSCTTSFRHPGAAIAPKAYYRVAAITSTFGHEVVGQAVHVASRDR